MSRIEIKEEEMQDAYAIEVTTQNTDLLISTTNVEQLKAQILSDAEKAENPMGTLKAYIKMWEDACDQRDALFKENEKLNSQILRQNLTISKLKEKAERLDEVINELENPKITMNDYEIDLANEYLLNTLQQIRDGNGRSTL